MAKVPPVKPDLAKFRYFGKISKTLGNFVIVYLVLGKILNLLWQFYMFWTIFHRCEWPKIE